MFRTCRIWTWYLVDCRSIQIRWLEGKKTLRNDVVDGIYQLMMLLAVPYRIPLCSSAARFSITHYTLTTITNKLALTTLLSLVMAGTKPFARKIEKPTGISAMRLGLKIHNRI